MMRKRNFSEMISYFNKKVSEMEIDTKYKMELLGMITAIVMEHDKESANPERKRGKWIHKVEPYAWVCSECGEETTSAIMGKPRYQWCPMCGADMKEGEAEC